MKRPFTGLKIIGLHNQRCYVIKDSILRIYFRLSDNPPLGWSYRFSNVWQTVQYPAKRPVGVEEDAIWIECTPPDVRPFHLEHLERAVAQANADFLATQLQKTIAEQQRVELDNQIQAQLDTLDNSLHSDVNPSVEGKNRLRFGIGCACAFLQRLIGVLRRRT